MEFCTAHRHYITWWLSELLRRVVFWLFTSVSEDHIASIFTVLLRNVGVQPKVMGSYWFILKKSSKMHILTRLTDVSEKLPTTQGANNIKWMNLRLLE
jgi:hypothetical protein